MNFKNKILIGVIHLPVLLGNPKFAGFDNLLDKVERDRKALEEGGVEAIILENTYDEPMLEKTGLGSRISFLIAVLELVKRTKLPVGLSVLWNDYEMMLLTALAANCQFIRLSVFVDDVAIPNQIIRAEPQKVIKYREKIGVSEVKIIADLQVKDCTHLEPDKDITTSALQALKHKPDALIITGEETGQPPHIEKINKVRAVVKDTPILIGSGVSGENLPKYFDAADGFIVGSSLKTGKFVDIQKVKKLVKIKRQLMRA